MLGVVGQQCCVRLRGALVSVVIYFSLLTSVTLNIGLHVVAVRTVGVLRYVITKFSRMDSIVYQIFLPMVLRWQASRARAPLLY